MIKTHSAGLQPCRIRVDQSRLRGPIIGRVARFAAEDRGALNAAEERGSATCDADLYGELGLVWCAVRLQIDGHEEPVYEERVTVWRAGSPAEAIELAEAEAAEYVAGLDGEYLGLAQVYTMADDLIAGSEVFSLMRTSSLEPTRYLNAYFNTGAERQADVKASEFD